MEVTEICDIKAGRVRFQISRFLNFHTDFFTEDALDFRVVGDPCHLQDPGIKMMLCDV